MTEIYGRTPFWDVFPEEEPEDEADTEETAGETTEE